MTTDLGQTIQRVALVLSVVLLLQVLWLLVQWMTHSAPDPVLPSESAFEVSGVDTSARFLDPNSGVSLVSKPLFWPGREPYVPPEGMDEAFVTDTAASDSALRETRLLGVYAAGDREGAILLHKGQRLRLMVGETIDGWELGAVGSDEASFSSGRESLSLVLEHAVTSPDANQRPVAKKRGGVQNSAPARSNSNNPGA